MIDERYGPTYNEFAFYADIAAEMNIPFKTPTVRRESITVGKDEILSALVWGEGSPEIVFLHGGGQNAHTWDYVALALDRPAVAIDLPGHGHSYWRADRDYSPRPNAVALNVALPLIAPDARVVVGMSLGGATTLHLAGSYPERVRKAVIVDVTPQVNDPGRTRTRQERGTVSLIGENQLYDTFEAMAETAIALSPFRGAEGVRRGVRHNSKQLDDGRWTWRYDLAGSGPRMPTDFTYIWQDVSNMTCPATLVVGGESTYVTPDDIDEMKRRHPQLEVISVPGAGHAVQSDKPLELTRNINEFAFGE